MKYIIKRNINLFAIEYETIDSVSKITKKELLHLWYIYSGGINKWVLSK